MLSLQGNTDLTEAPGSFVHSGYMEPSSDANRFIFANVDERVMAPGDRWAQLFIGKQLRCKDEELEDDLDFKRKRPTSVFVIHSIATRSAEKTQFVPANVRHARRSLRFVCCSIDALDDYELTPVKPFHSSLQERSRLYQTLPLEVELQLEYG